MDIIFFYYDPYFAEYVVHKPKGFHAFEQYRLCLMVI